MFILKCEAFDGESSYRHSNKCCQGDCHVSNTLVSVTPYAIDATPENRRLDWELGIQGLVCCGRYEFVRALSREWWVNKGRAVGLFDESTARRLMHKGSWHPTFEKVSQPVKPKVDRRANSCPQCGAKWDQVVCNSCGNVA